VGLRRVLPRRPEFFGGDLITSNETVHECLMPCTAELDHDVIDDRSESRIADQREPKCMALFVAVPTLPEGNNRM
jgi:hypothetical protein